MEIKTMPSDYYLTLDDIDHRISSFFAHDKITSFIDDLNYHKPFKSDNSEKGERSFASPETFIKGRHQNHMTKDIFKNAAKQLAGVKDECYTAACFEDIYNVVYEALEHTKGIGPLTIYDISLRIAWNIAKERKLSQEMKINLMPNKYVYLSCGAYDGAVRICKSLHLEMKIEKLPGIKKCCRVSSEFFADIFNVSPHENLLGIWPENNPIIPSCIVEDMLCVEFHYRKKGHNSRCC